MIAFEKKWYLIVGMLLVSVPILTFVPAQDTSETHAANRALQSAESYFSNKSTGTRYGIHTFYYNLNNAIEDIEIKLSHLKGMVKTLTTYQTDSALHTRITEIIKKLNSRISEYENDLKIARDYEYGMGEAPTIEQFLKIVTKGE